MGNPLGPFLPFGALAPVAQNYICRLILAHVNATRILLSTGRVEKHLVTLVKASGSTSYRTDLHRVGRGFEPLTTHHLLSHG